MATTTQTTKRTKTKTTKTTTTTTAATNKIGRHATGAPNGYGHDVRAVLGEKKICHQPPTRSAAINNIPQEASWDWPVFGSSQREAKEETYACRPPARSAGKKKHVSSHDYWLEALRQKAPPS